MELELHIVKDPCRDYGKARKRVFGVEGGSIGRAPDSYWVLPDPKCYVSGRHCEIGYRNGSFWLRDVSRNGVVLNDEVAPIERGRDVPLRDGDKLKIAQYELAVKVVDSADERSQDSLHTAAGNGLSARRFPRAGSRRVDTSNEHFAAVSGHNGETDLTETTGLDGTQALSSDSHGTDQEDSAESDWAGDTDTQLNRKVLRLRKVGGVESAARSNSEAMAGGLLRSELDDTGESKALTAGADNPAESFLSATLDAESMERHGVLLGLQDDAVTRAYKILRTRLRRRLTANHWRSIAVTGAGEGVGKTVTAINLAIAFAQDSRSPVFLVDLDLYRPQIANYLGIKIDRGLSDYLLGEASLDDIIYSTGVDGFAVIPNGRPLENSSELLGSDRMSDLAHFLEIQQPERFILYDMPPLLMSDDVLLFSSQIDCLLDVVAVGVTPRAAMEKSLEVLSEMNLLGVVLNRATERDRAGHYYYY